MAAEYKFIRAALVMSGLSPIFVLWAIRGVEGINHELWAGCCLMVFSVSNLLIKTIMWRARCTVPRVLRFKEIRDHREQLVTYLLAMTIPLVEVSFTSVSDALAGIIAFGFTAFLFFVMDLHYMNLFMAFAGYRLYEATPCGGDGEVVRGTRTYVIISKRREFDSQPLIEGYRLGGNVLMDCQDDEVGEVPAGQNREG